MSTNHSSLLSWCVEVFDTFDQDRHSVEEHVNLFLVSKEIADEGDQTFVLEVFSGCVRYSKIMMVIMDGFYARDGKATLRSEQSVYIVVSYLALFRLEELGAEHFKKFVSTVDNNKMYRFLRFLCDDRNLLTWMKDEWSKHYEHSFVQESLMAPILSILPELREMLKQMKCRIDNKVKPKKVILTKTETKPFNLTQPRARSIPVPQMIPKLKKHKPPPKSLYEEPSDFEMLGRSKEINRSLAERRLMASSKMQFACANPEKSQKTKEKMGHIIAEQESQLNFDSHKANPAPSFMNQEVPIKLNAAAILREGQLYQKREAEEIQKLEQLEAGSRDASAFMNWQTGMRQRDLDIQLAEIERRRLEGKLSLEDAILAKQNLVKENKVKVHDMKQEAKQVMLEYLEKRFREEQEMRMLVEATMEGHRSTKDAKFKLTEYKKKLVQEVNEESRELMKRALEEAESEMRRKMDIIHEIRAMEAVPMIRQKFVDLTSTAGAGLLSEMSIAELRERLALMKTTEEEEEEMKRDEILEAKQAKDQVLLDTLEMISKHRSEQTKAAAIRLEEKKKTSPKAEIKDPKLLELQEKLDAKKAERLREQENSKLLPSKKSAQRTRSLIKQKKNLEESRWEELEQRRERAAKLMSTGMSSSTSAGRLGDVNRLTLAT